MATTQIHHVLTLYEFVTIDWLSGVWPLSTWACREYYEPYRREHKRNWKQEMVLPGLCLQPWFNEILTQSVTKMFCFVHQKGIFWYHLNKKNSCYEGLPKIGPKRIAGFALCHIPVICVLTWNLILSLHKGDVSVKDITMLNSWDFTSNACCRKDALHDLPQAINTVPGLHAIKILIIHSFGAKCHCTWSIGIYQLLLVFFFVNASIETTQLRVQHPQQSAGCVKCAGSG